MVSRSTTAVRRWLGDRRVLTKFFVVAGLAVAGTAATGAFAIAGISSLSETRGQEVGQSVPYIAALQTAALQAKSAANDERGFLLSGEAKYRESALGAHADVSAQLAEAAQLADNPTESDAVTAIQRDIDAWFGALATEFETYDRDRAGAVEAAMGPNRELRKAYEVGLEEEILRAEEELLTGREFAGQAAETRREMYVTIGIAIGLSALMSIFVGRIVAGPLHRVSRALDDLARGDLTADSEVHQRDEIGQMAQALRTATGTLRQTVGALAEHSAMLAGAAEELSVSSKASIESADAGAQRAGAVSASATQMSHNIQTVAVAAEQMGSSIREIAQGAAQAADVATRAVQVAGDTNSMMTKLGESSTEIGNVVKVITSIAEQTNLLALNATIEAARAGDAGKGFAVVASEVKDLAQETARATEDIANRVVTIQADTTGAVGAISEIGDIIARINEFQTTIASAVEEQTVTTNEMSRNVTEAAAAGGEVAETIEELAGSVRRTTDGISESARAADSLADMSGALRQLVAQFRY